MKLKHSSLGMLLCLPLLSLNLGISSFSYASAYVGTQDKQLHYDMQTLVEWGYINAAVTTFPVPWKGLADELATISPSGMPFRPRQAYLRLNHYLNQHKKAKSRQFLTLQVASDDIRFRGFDDGVEETGKLTVSSEFYMGRLSGQVSVNYASGGRKNMDNSFIAYQFGDWNVRLGSLDQWWGPGQSSSLIMSNNTRPVKALAFSRSTNTQSTNEWLSWLGPWYFTSQIGQLEKNRDVANAKFLMNRFNARPFKGFEFGLSWTAMWGGQGQPSGLRTFWEVITFQGICLNEDGDCSIGGETKRGNHMAGIDLSYTAHMFDRPFTFYVQRVGEDAVDGYRITDNANLFGVSTYWQGAKIFVETSDTNVACDGTSTSRNCYYENGTYSSGYRLYGRSMGSTFDSDAKQLTIGANIRFSGGDMAQITMRSAELNADGQRPSPVLTKDVSEDVLELSGFYQKPMGDWLLKAGGSIANRDFKNTKDEIDAAIYLKAQLEF